MTTLVNRDFLHTSWEVICVSIEHVQLYENLFRREDWTTKGRICMFCIILLTCLAVGLQSVFSSDWLCLLCDYLFWLLASVCLWFSAAGSVICLGGTLLPVEGPIRVSNQTIRLTSFLNQLTSRTTFFSGQPFKQLVPPPVWASQPNLKLKVFSDRKAN